MADVDAWYAFAVQEEVGTRGSGPAAYEVELNCHYTWGTTAGVCLVPNLTERSVSQVRERSCRLWIHLQYTTRTAFTVDKDSGREQHSMAT